MTRRAALCVVWHCLSARVVVCLCCAAVLLRAGATAKSRYRSLSGSALPFPKGVTCIGPCGKNSHSTGEGFGTAAGRRVFGTAAGQRVFGTAAGRGGVWHCVSKAVVGLPSLRETVCEHLCRGQVERGPLLSARWYEHTCAVPSRPEMDSGT